MFSLSITKNIQVQKTIFCTKHLQKKEHFLSALQEPKSSINQVIK